MEFAQLDNEFTQTKQQNTLLRQEIDGLNDQIARKTSEYESLIEEIDVMSRTIENY